MSREMKHLDVYKRQMKYIKDQMGNRNTSDISPDSGVIVSLSAESTNLQLTEAQIKMQAQQDAELETDQTMSGDTGTLSQGTSAAYTDVYKRQGISSCHFKITYFLWKCCGVGFCVSIRNSRKVRIAV